MDGALSFLHQVQAWSIYTLCLARTFDVSHSFALVVHKQAVIHFILSLDHKKKKKRHWLMLSCLSLFQITFESFLSETECFRQKGMVAASQRWRSVVVLGKLPDRAILMVMWQSVELCPGCCTPSL